MFRTEQEFDDHMKRMNDFFPKGPHVTPSKNDIIEFSLEDDEELLNDYANLGN